MTDVVLTITFRPTEHRVDVSGPIGDKLLCYGLLGMAVDVLREHWRQNASRIERPNLKIELPGNGRGGQA